MALTELSCSFALQTVPAIAAAREGLEGRAMPAARPATAARSACRREISIMFLAPQLQHDLRIDRRIDGRYALAGGMGG